MSPPNTTLEPGELDSTMEFSGTPEIPAEADAFDDEADEVVDDLAMAAMAAGVDFVPQTLNVAVTAEVEMQNGKAAEAVPEIPATVEEAKGPDEFTISSTSRVVAPSTEEKEYVDLDTEIVDTEIIDAEAAFRIDNKPDESNLKISYRRADEEDQNKASSSSDSSDDSSSDEDDEQGDPETMPDSDFNPDASDSDSDSDSDILPSTKMTLEEREKLLIAMESMGAEDEDGVPGGELPKTKNEIELPPVEPLPISVVPEEMPLEEIGTIHSLVGENLIVEAKVSGEYRVLDVDSILCFADRSVLGRVFDTFGPVSQPMYQIRFNTTTDIPAQSTLGTPIYYAPDLAHFVFTQALRGKGSDASNKFDEEPDDAEREFSDDEEEAEFRRMQKLKKRGGAAGQNSGREIVEDDAEGALRGNSGRGRGRGRGRGGGDRVMHERQQGGGRPVAQPRSRLPPRPDGGYGNGQWQQQPYYGAGGQQQQPQQALQNILGALHGQPAAGQQQQGQWPQQYWQSQPTYYGGQGQQPQQAYGQYPQQYAQQYPAQQYPAQQYGAPQGQPWYPPGQVPQNMFGYGPQDFTGQGYGQGYGQGQRGRGR